MKVDIPVTNKVLVVVNPTTPTSSLKVDVPVTPKLSSTVIVPPAESIVKFPDVVSISLLPVMPICTLSTVAPPLKSASPVNVETPVTSKFLLSLNVPSCKKDPAKSVV